MNKSRSKKGSISRPGVVSLVLVLLLSTVFEAEADARPFPEIKAPHYLWFHLDGFVGVGGRLSSKSGDPSWILTTRAGMSLVTPYWILSIAGTLRTVDLHDQDKLDRMGIGMQVEAVSIPFGLSGYFGPYVNLDGKPGFVAGLGWAIFSLELDAFSLERSFGARLFVNVRIPLSVGAFILWSRAHAAKLRRSIARVK